MRRAPRQFRHAWKVAVLLAVLTNVVSPVSVSGRQPGHGDISASQLGRSLINSASARFRALGYQARPLRIYKDAAGYLVAPSDAVLTMDEQGVFVPLTAAAPNVQSGGGPATVSQAVEGNGYQTMADGCFARIYSGVNAAAMDHCYQVLKLLAESSPTKDYWALNHYASIYAGGWGARWAMVGAEAFTPQTWSKWSPGSNYTGNCTNSSISITMSGYSLTYSIDKCEMWRFTKWNPQVKFQNRWDGPVVNTNRELAFEIGVSVSPGAWPQWFVPASVQANG